MSEPAVKFATKLRAATRKQEVATQSRQSMKRFEASCPLGREHISSGRRDCSIISISRVKRASPQPLTWFRSAPFCVHVLASNNAAPLETYKRRRGIGAPTRAWPPLARRERDARKGIALLPRKTKGGVASITRKSPLETRALARSRARPVVEKQRRLALALHHCSVLMFGKFFNWPLKRNIPGDCCFFVRFFFGIKRSRGWEILYSIFAGFGSSSNDFLFYFFFFCFFGVRKRDCD